MGFLLIKMPFLLIGEFYPSKPVLICMADDPLFASSFYYFDGFPTFQLWVCPFLILLFLCPDLPCDLMFSVRKNPGFFLFISTSKLCHFCESFRQTKKNYPIRSERGLPKNPRKHLQNLIHRQSDTFPARGVKLSSRSRKCAKTFRKKVSDNIYTTVTRVATGRR